MISDMKNELTAKNGCVLMSSTPSCPLFFGFFSSSLQIRSALSGDKSSGINGSSAWIRLYKKNPFLYLQIKTYYIGIQLVFVMSLSVIIKDLISV
jgi:hypothetical protein